MSLADRLPTVSTDCLECNKAQNFIYKQTFDILVKILTSRGQAPGSACCGDAATSLALSTHAKLGSGAPHNDRDEQ